MTLSVAEDLHGNVVDGVIVKINEYNGMKHEDRFVGDSQRWNDGERDMDSGE